MMEPLPPAVLVCAPVDEYPLPIHPRSFRARCRWCDKIVWVYPDTSCLILAVSQGCDCMACAYARADEEGRAIVTQYVAMWNRERAVRNN